MNENIARIIEIIAQKLGTTSEYIWGVLLRQAPIDATMGALYIIISMVAAYLLWKAHVKMSLIEEGEIYNVYDTNDGIGMVMVFLAVFVSLGLVFSIVNLPNVFAGFFNPEYWALNKILEAI